MPPHYRLLEKLGEGQGGSVWKYEDVHTKELVAIKRIDPGTTMDVGAEIEALKALKDKPHEHIINLICSFSEDVQGTRYNFIVFQFAPGGTLLSLLRNLGPLSMDFVRSIIRQVAEGTDHIHNVVGYVHGDLKLENILFKNSEKTEIVICDLGLALPVDLDSDLMKCIFAGGTTEYVAYELWEKQITGKPQDMWAIGVLTYALLCKKFPFQLITTKEVRDMVSRKFKSSNVQDLSRETSNPILAATDIFTRDALNKIKKGIDWTSFPKDSDDAGAKDFIEKLLDLDYKKRYTAKDALSHKFLDPKYSNIKPASRKPVPTSKSSSSSSRSTTSRNLGRKRGQTESSTKKSASVPRNTGPFISTPSEKFMKSDCTPHSCDLIGLRGGGGSGDSDIELENLSFWQRQTEILQQSSWRTKLLMVLSVRAGYTMANGRLKLVPFAPIPRALAESGTTSPVHHRYSPSVSEPSSRAPTIVEGPSPRASQTPSIADETSRPPSRAPSIIHQTSSPAPRSPNIVERAPENESRPPSIAEREAENWSRPPSIAERAPENRSRPSSVVDQAPEHVPTPPPERAHTPPPPPAAAAAPLPAHNSRPPSPTPSQTPLPASRAGSIDSLSGKQPTVVSVTDYAGSGRSSIASRRSNPGSVAGKSDAASTTSRQSKTKNSRPASLFSRRSNTSNSKREGSIASSRSSGDRSAHQGALSTAPSIASLRSAGSADGGRKGKRRASRDSVARSQKSNGSAKKKPASVASTHAGPADDEAKGKEKERSVEGVSAEQKKPATEAEASVSAGSKGEQEGLPEPQPESSESRSKHYSNHQYKLRSSKGVPITPDTRYGPVPRAKIDKAMENSYKPIDQQSISTLSRSGSSSGRSNASHANSK